MPVTTLPTFPPSPLATALIPPTAAEAWSQPFTVAPQYANGAISPIGGPIRVSITLTAPQGEAVPLGAKALIYKIDSTGTPTSAHKVWINEDFTIEVPGVYVAHKPESAAPYGVDVHGYTSSASGSE